MTRRLIKEALGMTKQHQPNVQTMSGKHQDTYPDLITIKEAAKTLNVTERTISRMIQQQELTSLKVDSRRLIWRDSVLKMSCSNLDRMSETSGNFQNEVISYLKSIHDTLQALSISPNRMNK